jgi:O-antigen/teichoic acid export membrane protein
LIQNRRGSEPQYVSAAWWFSVGQAAVIYSCIFLTAPLFSQVYGHPELTELLRVAAFAALLDGAMSAKAYVALREMNFRTWTFIRHGSGVLGVLVTVALSYIIGDVWALVLGYCAESAIRCALSFLLCPFVPQWGWDPVAARELFGFSKNLLGVSFLNLIFARSDIFVLGKLISTADLGLYSLAILLVQTPTSFVMNIFGQTMLTTYSRIQTTPERISRIALQSMSMILLLGIPALGFVVLCGDSLLMMAYGEPYRSAYGPLAIAALVGLINILNGQITLIFYSKGLPQLHRRCVSLMALTMLVAIYPFTKWLGMVGGQVACLVAVSVGFAFQLVRVRALTGLALAKVAEAAAISVLISFLVGFLFMAVGSWGAIQRPLSALLFGIVGMGTASLLGAFVFSRSRFINTIID